MIIQKFYYRSKQKIRLNFNPWLKFKIKWETVFGDINRGPKTFLYTFPEYYSRPRNYYDISLIWYEKPSPKILLIFEDFFDLSLGINLFMIRKYKSYTINCQTHSEYKKQKELFIKKIKKESNNKSSHSYLKISLSTPLLLNKTLENFLIYEFPSLNTKKNENTIDGLNYIINLIINGIENYTLLQREEKGEFQNNQLFNKNSNILKNKHFKEDFIKNFYEKRQNLKIKMYQFKTTRYLKITLPISSTFLLNYLDFANILYKLSEFQVPLCSPFRLGLGILNLSNSFG